MVGGKVTHLNTCDGVQDESEHHQIRACGYSLQLFMFSEEGENRETDLNQNPFQT